MSFDLLLTRLAALAQIVSLWLMMTSD